MIVTQGNFLYHFRTELCKDSKQSVTLSMMLRFSPAKSDLADDIDAIITPPFKGSLWSTSDTPTSGPRLDGSYTENEIGRKPLGRFHSFDVKRSLFSFKRLADEQTTVNSPATKRLRDAEEQFKTLELQTENAACDGECIKSMVQRLSSDNDVIADGSKPYALPTIAGKHSDLKAIAPETLDAVLRGCYDDEIDSVTVIDCRYPYEYEGGHVKGALNLYTREAVQEYLLCNNQDNFTSKRNVLIFHCEFSSERGPKLYRHLRSEDRAMNKDHYPRLRFPEIYILEGGYKNFYLAHMDKCEPTGYTPMLHKDYAADLRHFRGKSKSWTAGERPRLMRTSLRF